MRKIIKIISVFAAVFFILFMVTNLSAQGNSKIDNLVQKLQHKVLLSDDQAKSVKVILINYSENKTDEELNRSKQKVEALLDEKQMMKYELIKNDWWQEVKKQIN